MTEDDARKLLWAKAVEENDPEGRLLPHARRHEASAQVTGVDRPARLAARARWICRDLRERGFGATAFEERAAWPGGTLAALCGLVFLLALGADSLTAGGRVNIIAFPLLGLILWNFAVFAWLITQKLAGKSLCRVGPVKWLAGKWADIRQAALERSHILPRDERELWLNASRQFAAEWLGHSRQLTLAHFAGWLHMAAIAAAAGLVAGMYLRGLAFEYRAGWGSTFLEADALRSFLAITLGPAAMLSGIELPNAAALAELRWSHNPDGVNAAPWIHLYAVTAMLFVVAPRLGVWFANWRVAREQAADFPLALDTPYFKRLFPDESSARTGSIPLQSSESKTHEPAAAPTRQSTMVIGVMPCNLDIKTVARERLREWFQAAANAVVPMDLRERVAYGAEEDAAAELAASADQPDAVLVIFSAAATPEQETHGALLDALRDAANSGDGKLRRVGVALEETVFAERFRKQVGGEERIAQRRETWARLIEPRGLPWFSIDLASGDAPPLNVIRQFLGEEASA